MKLYEFENGFEITYSERDEIKPIFEILSEKVGSEIEKLVEGYFNEIKFNNIRLQNLKYYKLNKLFVFAEPQNRLMSKDYYLNNLKEIYEKIKHILTFEKIEDYYKISKVIK